MVCIFGTTWNLISLYEEDGPRSHRADKPMTDADTSSNDNEEDYRGLNIEWVKRDNSL